MGVRKALTGARPQAALNPAHLSVPPGQMFHQEMEALDQTLAGWSTFSCTSPRPVLSCQLSASFSVPSGHPCPSIISHTSACPTGVCRRASWQGSSSCGAWPSRNCSWQQVCTWASGRVTGDRVYGVLTAPVSTMIGFEACFPLCFAFPQNLQA